MVLKKCGFKGKYGLHFKRDKFTSEQVLHSKHSIQIIATQTLPMLYREC